MSTYNSKFSGAEIDEILGKAEELATLHEAGQLGGRGSGVSEKEAFAKELGATHKHTITLALIIAEYNVVTKFRFVTYMAGSAPLTVDSLCGTLVQGDNAFINGYYGLSYNGMVGVGDAVLGVGTGEAGAELTLNMKKRADTYEFINTVNFTAQSYNSTTVALFEETPTSVQSMIEQGFTFTDDVTEL